LGLINTLLSRHPMATLCQGFFSRSKLGDTGTELALLDHILASPGIARGAAILTTPAGARGSRWGDHDPILADFEFGFNPTPLKPKRAPITWAHHYSPGAWAAHNADTTVNETLDGLLRRLESEAATRDSIDLNAVFTEFVEIAMPRPANRPEGPYRDYPYPHAAEQAVCARACCVASRCVARWWSHIARQVSRPRRATAVRGTPAAAKSRVRSCPFRGNPAFGRVLSAAVPRSVVSFPRQSRGRQRRAAVRSSAAAASRGVRCRPRRTSAVARASARPWHRPAPSPPGCARHGRAPAHAAGRQVGRVGFGTLVAIIRTLTAIIRTLTAMIRTLIAIIRTPTAILKTPFFYKKKERQG
jgi:hypothetical protein